MTDDVTRGRPGDVSPSNDNDEDEPATEFAVEDEDASHIGTYATETPVDAAVKAAQKQPSKLYCVVDTLTGEEMRVWHRDIEGRLEGKEGTEETFRITRGDNVAEYTAADSTLALRRAIENADVEFYDWCVYKVENLDTGNSEQIVVDGDVKTVCPIELGKNLEEGDIVGFDYIPDGVTYSFVKEVGDEAVAIQPIEGGHTMSLDFDNVMEYVGQETGDYDLLHDYLQMTTFEEHSLCVMTPEGDLASVEAEQSTPDDYADDDTVEDSTEDEPTEEFSHTYQVSRSHDEWDIEADSAKHAVRRLIEKTPSYAWTEMDGYVFTVKCLDQADYPTFKIRAENQEPVIVDKIETETPDELGELGGEPDDALEMLADELFGDHVEATMVVSVDTGPEEDPEDVIHEATSDRISVKEVDIPSRDEQEDEQEQDKPDYPTVDVGDEVTIAWSGDVLDGEITDINYNQDPYVVTVDLHDGGTVEVTARKIANHNEADNKDLPDHEVFG